MLSEIQHYGDSESDQMTLNYLKALNNLFERGILCTEHISSSNQSVLERMKAGFKFFEEWREDVIEKGDSLLVCMSICLKSGLALCALINIMVLITHIGVNIRDPKQTAFLAWQVHVVKINKNLVLYTYMYALVCCSSYRNIKCNHASTIYIHCTQTWDLLEMMYSGFTSLCQDFIQKHGESKHYIVPVRINGSSIESLFSRFKYNANGNLSAVNYESAMVRLLTTN